MNTDRTTNIKLISVLRRKAKNDHMSLSELTEKLQNGNKIKSSKISGRYGVGTIREERGKPVTRGISEAKPRSRFKLPYPIVQTTYPHNG